MQQKSLANAEPVCPFPFNPEICETSKDIVESMGSGFLERYETDLQLRQKHIEEKSIIPRPPSWELSEGTKRIMEGIEVPFMERVECDLERRYHAENLRTHAKQYRFLEEGCTFTPLTNWIYMRADAETGAMVEVPSHLARASAKKFMRRMDQDTKRRFAKDKARAQFMGGETHVKIDAELEPQLHAKEYKTKKYEFLLTYARNVN